MQVALIAHCKGNTVEHCLILSGTLGQESSRYQFGCVENAPYEFSRCSWFDGLTTNGTVSPRWRCAGNSRRRYVNDNTDTKRQKNRRADIYISIAVVEEEAAAPKKTEASPTAAEKKEEAPAAAKPDKPDAVQPADGGEKPN